MSFDTVDENRAFVEKFSFNFPLLCDTDRTIGLAYGACDDQSASHAKRVSYLIGADGNVRKAYPQVDAGAHPDEILADLDT